MQTYGASTLDIGVERLLSAVRAGVPLASAFSHANTMSLAVGGPPSDEPTGIARAVGIDSLVQRALLADRADLSGHCVLANPSRIVRELSLAVPTT